jgi:hypothetical protein
MGDIDQEVRWALHRECPFRTGEQWYSPDKTIDQLGDFWLIALAHDANRIVDGICVVAWSDAQDNSGKSYEIPMTGFRISERLNTEGGLPQVIATCKSCAANVKSLFSLDIGGCFGQLSVAVDSDEFDDLLWRIIRERDLEQRLRSLFPVTVPLWYGLWINSPLQQVHAEFLIELFRAVPNDAWPAYSLLIPYQVRHFTRALIAAIRWKIPLQVSLHPAGHCDFGTTSIASHCPRCKATAVRRRPGDAEAFEPHHCRVCGHQFNPDDYGSSTYNEMSGLDRSLRALLGLDGYEEFGKRFLLAQGCSPEIADEVVKNARFHRFE